MRTLYIVIIILAIIIIGWVIIHGLIGNQTEELSEILDNVVDSIEDDDWDTANTYFEELREKWVSIRDKWTILLDHHEIDNIDLAMSRSDRYIQSKSKDMSLGEMEVLKQLFFIVKENESLTLSNIL